MLRKQIATAFSVLGSQGVQGVAKVSLEKAGMWWRRGHPSPFAVLGNRGPDVARLDGCRFLLDSPLISESLRYLLLSGKHEAPERRLLKRFLDPGLPLVELGGALGVVSCVANKRLAEPDRHVVVEANPALIPLLTANRDLNHCQFTIVNRALSYDSPLVDFSVAGNVLASSVHVRTNTSVQVPATTLGQLLDEVGFDRCSLVCDIEGTEVDLVERELPILVKRVAVIIMEVHERLVGPDTTNRMLAALRQAGFEVVDRAWETMAFRNRPLTDGWSAE